MRRLTSKTAGQRLVTSSPAKAIDVKLTKFLPSLAEVPGKELAALKERAVRSGFDFIDFWAVDFDWHPGQPFSHLGSGTVGHTQEEHAAGHHHASSGVPNQRVFRRKATFTSAMRTGTSTRGPITAAKAAPWAMPKVATATAIASSKLLEAAVKLSVADWG